MRTNTGVPIRQALVAARAISSDGEVRRYLDRAISHWKGNAAGTTKFAALWLAARGAAGRGAAAAPRGAAAATGHEAARPVAERAALGRRAPRGEAPREAQVRPLLAREGRHLPRRLRLPLDELHPDGPLGDRLRLQVRQVHGRDSTGGVPRALGGLQRLPDPSLQKRGPRNAGRRLFTIFPPPLAGGSPVPPAR